MICAACSGTVPDGAARCPSCRIVLDADAGAGSAATPQHVELYFGAAPEIASAPADEEDDSSLVEQAERPQTSVRHPANIGWRKLVALGVALVLAVGVTGLVSIVRRVSTGETRTFERYLDAPELSPGEAPPPFDPEAAIRISQAFDAPAFAAALAAHRPLPAPGSVSVHAYFDAFLAAWVALDPSLALTLGLEPFPKDVAPASHEDDARMLLLFRDVWRAAGDWPGRASLSPHDELDLAVLRARTQSMLRASADNDRNAVSTLYSICEPLVLLRDTGSAAAPERAAAARAVLAALPAEMKDLVDDMRSPPRELVVATARRLDAEAAWIRTFAGGWTGLDEATVGALRTEAAPAADAVAACAARLRSDVLPRARGALPIGRAAFDARLRDDHGLPMDARDVYLHALGAFRDAAAEMNDVQFEEAGHTRTPRLAANERIAALRARMDAWLPAPPHEPGLRFGDPPAAWFLGGWGGFYVDGGPFAPPGPAVIYLPPNDALDTPGWGEAGPIEKLHTIAHETYPGHRLEALTSTQVCSVRRFASNRCFTEGWASYAEDLIHETGDCVGGDLDRWLRARDRWWRAKLTLVDVLFATGAESRPKLERLLDGADGDASGEPVPDVDADPDAEADAGEQGMSQGHLADYLIGRDEIMRLRALEERRLGDRFDLRTFHARLLGEGPVPTRWVERQWAEEARRAR